MKMYNEASPLKVDVTKLLTIKSYALQEGITVQAVYKKIREGRVATQKIDGKYFIVK